MLVFICLFLVTYFSRTIIFSDFTSLNHNLNKLYESLIIILLLAACYNSFIDSKNTILLLALAIVIVFLLKDQIFIDDDQYLSSIIELRQKEIELSEKIKSRTLNPYVKSLSEKIVNSSSDITLLKSNVVNYKPMLKLTNTPTIQPNTIPFNQTVTSGPIVMPVVTPTVLPTVPPTVLPVTNQAS